ncbi:MAG: 50S ribosomal protein L23 [Candidatus Woesearchaeota archaeon]
MIKTVLATEKATRLMEAENKLVFVVDKKATKESIKKEIEEMFKVQVLNVNTVIGPDARKKAYVTFSDKTPAVDLATKLGLM